MTYSCTTNMQPAHFGNHLQTSFTSELFSTTQNMFNYTGNFLPTVHEQVMKVEPITPTSSKPSSPHRDTKNNQIKKKKRPGRDPAIGDDEISPVELMKRNQRRERNRSAAARCRQKRAVRAETLEASNLRLSRENQQLFEENRALLAQNAFLQEQLKVAANGQMAPHFEPYLDSPFQLMPTSLSTSSMPTIESNSEQVFNSFTMPFEPTNMMNQQGRSFST